MVERFEDLNVRLIQVRLKPDVLAEEYATFIERTKLAEHQLHSTNAITQSLDFGILEDVDAVLIGGAGAYSAAQTYEWTDDLTRLVHETRDRDLPLFGSCWGHQFMARALGGSTIHDPTRIEIGCLPVELTEPGESDELFGGFPRTFMANMGHHDRVERLPDDAIELATSTVSPYQAFKIVGKPIYGTQFHSELNATTEEARLYAYRDHYPSLRDDATFHAVIDSLQETTEVDGLLNRFLNTFAVGA